MISSRALLSVLLLLAATGCKKPPEQLLIGKWKSNRELTIATIQKSFDPNPENERLKRAQDGILSLFGRLEVTYSAETMISIMPSWRDFPEDRHQTKYKVTASTGDSVTLEYENWPEAVINSQFLKKEPVTLHFISPNRYWVQASVVIPTVDTSDWKEYFDRVSK